ncbi:hypothetical protein H0H93_014376 [Arthromyces matolae]|nr:hypothetical protein H0H93_014376 [Arthromyces matolae]
MLWFATKVGGEEGGRKMGLSEEEIAKVKEEWEEKQRRKKEKEGEGKKEEEKGKEVKSTTETPSKPVHERYALHRDFFTTSYSQQPPPQPQPYWSAQPPTQQWPTPQPPPPEQSALYANYGYGAQWQRQQQQQQLHQIQAQYQQPPPPPPQPLVQPPYNPYQPTAGYPHQPYIPQPAPQPIPTNPYPPPPPQYFQQQQPQQQQRHHLHHTPPHPLPPAKRQRFDNGPQHPPQPPPPQPQFQAPPPPPPQNINLNLGYSSPARPNPSQGGPVHLPLGPSSRGGGGGRGAPPAQRGGGGSFRGGRHQGPSNRSRHDNSFGPRDGQHGHGHGHGQQMSSSFGGGGSGGGKKDENRRTLTDFKIIGFEIKDLDWRWGILPTIKVEPTEEDISTVKEEPADEDVDVEISTQVETQPASQPDLEPNEFVEPSSTSTTLPAEQPLSEEPTQTQTQSTSHPNPHTPPPSRIRIYFHTPVTPDDSRPIPHHAATSGSAVLPIPQQIPSEPRKGKRKKDDDDDDDEQEDRGRKPPPPLPSRDLHDEDRDRASVAPSVAHTETPSEDWLMAAIVEGDGEEDETSVSKENREGTDVDADADAEDDEERMHVSRIVEVELEGQGEDENSKDKVNAPEEPEATAAPAHPEHADVETDPDCIPGLGSLSSTTKVTTKVLVSVPASAPASYVDNAGGASATPALKDDSTSSSSFISSVGHEHGVDNDADHVALLINTQDSSSLSSSAVERKVTTTSQTTTPASIAVNGSTDTGLGSAASLPPSSDGTINGVGHGHGPSSTDHEETQTQIDELEAEASATQSMMDQEREQDHDHDQDHLPEPPASPITSATLLSTSSASAYGGSPVVPPVVKPDSTITTNATTPTTATATAIAKVGRTPSANRLSISYAGGNRRLLVDAEVVESLKLFRQEGRIEVVLSIVGDGEDVRGLKGILVEGLSDLTKSYLPLETIYENPEQEGDDTLPPFKKATLPSTITLCVYLDTARPLSEPKWAKTGDIHDWLKSMFGRMFWVAGDAADGWEKKIQVVDPDPPPTIWTVLDGWATNSPAGILSERQRFLKTHMTETDNILEILLRLVRGERATASYQSGPAISAPSISGPLLSALSQGSAHAAQQTHVSLAVLAMFRMGVEYAQKASGEKGKTEAEERMGEIIRCLPSHLIYKSLDGIFKEWRVEKKGR